MYHASSNLQNNSKCPTIKYNKITLKLNSFSFIINTCYLKSMLKLYPFQLQPFLVAVYSFFQYQYFLNQKSIIGVLVYSFFFNIETFKVTKQALGFLSIPSFSVSPHFTSQIKHWVMLFSVNTIFKLV
ncbi:hypothetical protein DICPUDRAFT_76127 [Dictyostelium purpureum]|uniref:Uncharacterized protein n=1 Tax=Dictyostelium purpureum TaxID=5786 RepID=F0ZCP0_DICPU|nr:uncharacterized protein DICPUDRAFT_76127 [Dictyostelium purpureum]EGC38329.1 hypothetical protein DICPUDRAFT_76127 [Dictyostelium purpureum]|eukprot:XP_003285190.1 hypothetical protein DICPUDRAFT_76127 [Dictyostelium purpureum]